MVTKQKLLFKVFIGICLFSFSFAFAQENSDTSKDGTKLAIKNSESDGTKLATENSENNGSKLATSTNEVIDENVEEKAQTKWQFLEWEEENPEFVLKYEIVIEQYTEKYDTYNEINRLQTEDNTTKIQVEPLLSPGNYRFKVITYNLIGVPETESDFFNFRIFKAFLPEVNKVNSTVNLGSTLYLEEINDGIFDIKGKNLFALSERDTDISFTNYALVNQNKKNEAPLKPNILSRDEKSREMKVQFNMKDLDVGSYNFIATDASGLKSENKGDNEVIVKFRKRIDLDLSLGYLVPVVLFDDTINKYMDSSVYPLSAIARVTFIPSKHTYGYFGAGFQATYSRMYAEFDNYTIDGNLFQSYLSFVYQYPIRIKVENSDQRKHLLTLEAHAGAGLTMFNNFMFHFTNVGESEALNSINLSAICGGAVQWYIFKRFYTELNVDFSMAFISDMKLGMLQSSLSFGWQL